MEVVVGGPHCAGVGNGLIHLPCTMHLRSQCLFRFSPFPSFSLGCQDAIGAGNGLVVVLAAMRGNPKIVEVQDNGTLALQHLVENHAANQVCAFAAPGHW